MRVVVIVYCSIGNWNWESGSCKKLVIDFKVRKYFFFEFILNVIVLNFFFIYLIILNFEMICFLENGFIKDGLFIVSFKMELKVGFSSR